MFKTYIYQIKSKTSKQRDQVRVWSNCETKAFKAAYAAFGSTHHFLNVPLKTVYSRSAGISTE